MLINVGVFLLQKDAYYFTAALSVRENEKVTKLVRGLLYDLILLLKIVIAVLVLVFLSEVL